MVNSSQIQSIFKRWFFFQGG